MQKKNNGNFSFYAVPCHKPFVMPAGFLTEERKKELETKTNKFLNVMKKIEKEKELSLKKTLKPSNK